MHVEFFKMLCSTLNLPSGAVFEKFPYLKFFHFREKFSLGCGFKWTVPSFASILA